MGMYTCFFFCFLFVDTIIGVTSNSQRPGFCNYSGKIEACCTDYYLHDNTCKPCIGSFGAKCAGGPCIEGYYGHGCKDICNCTTQQDCDRFKGCVNRTDESNKGQADIEDHGNVVDKLIPIILGVIFSVGSILLVSLFLLKQKLEYLRKHILGFTNSRNPQNQTEEGSEEPGEDYSKMTRASNNYNILSFNRRFNAISTVNATDEEDLYDDTGAGVTTNNNTHNGQDSYVTLALTNNLVLPSMKNAIEEIQNDCQTLDNEETRESGDTYVTLIPCHIPNATKKL